jgi:hypothetical protein
MKTIALRTLIIAVATSAAFGIYALVASHFGETQGKILLTTLCVSCASVLALACGPALERRLLGGLPLAGVLVSLAGVGCMIVAIWAELHKEGLWKTAFSLTILGTGVAHASLLALAPLAPRHAVYRGTGYACGGLLAGLLIAAMWGEVGDSGFWRLVGVVSILLCSLTILVPILARMARPSETRPSVPGSNAVRFCPCCGAAVESSSGVIQCAACGARSRVILSPPSG